MKRLGLFGVILVLWLAQTAHVGATNYAVIVTILEQGFYRVDNAPGYLIQTRYCYEWRYFDRGTLVYGNRYTRNWIWFGNGRGCDVAGVYYQIE